MCGLATDDGVELAERAVQAAEILVNVLPPFIHLCLRMYNKDNLARIAKLNALAPDAMKAFWAFDKLSVADGAIPVKYKELMAIAVALTTQCPYCIEIHSGNARKAGATEQRLPKQRSWQPRSEPARRSPMRLTP